MPVAEPDMKTSWADAVDAEDLAAIQLPLPTETFDPKTNIKTVVEYKLNDEDKKVKVTKTYKIEVRRVSKSIAKRKAWVKFGGAKGEPAGPNSANTIVSPDEVYMVFVGGKEQIQQEVEQDDPFNKLKAKQASGVQCRLCKGPHWTTKCPYKDQLEDLQQTMQGAEGTPGEEAAPSTEGAPAAPAAAKPAPTSGKYVPPGARDGGKRQGESMNFKSREELATIRVTNLSEDTRESDLQELFKPFGPIARIYLAKDKITGQSKGFAFINYFKKEDAAKAIQGVSGYGYDHLILNVEWAKPQGDK